MVHGLDVRSSVLASQTDAHARFGGVVPEVAARAHVESIRPLVHLALARAGVHSDELDAVAATQGPGLAGALMVGFSFAKALAWSLGRPFPRRGPHGGPSFRTEARARRLRASGRGAAGLRGAQSDRPRRRMGRLPRAGYHDRRRGRGGLRQARALHGPRLSGRARHRQGVGGREPRSRRFPAGASGPSLRLFRSAGSRPRS